MASQVLERTLRLNLDVLYPRNLSDSRVTLHSAVRNLDVARK